MAIKAKQGGQASRQQALLGGGTKAQ